MATDGVHVEAGAGPIYDRLGLTYATTRQEDPRIAAAIRGALGPVESVVNVGAGTGSYEPADALVIAIEPSGAMIAQRAAGRPALVVQGVAEALPLPDGAVPDFQTVMRPTLVSLNDGKAHTLQQIREAVATALGVNEEDQEQLGCWNSPTPDGKNQQTKLVEIADELSPSEAVGRLVQAADAAVAAELLDRVLAQPPAFLERLALRLLEAMGYGGRESLMEHTGKSGDAGLDGLVRQDALGLELVGVQAKRYEKFSSVSRPELQAFVGALHGAQTSRGVFVTTARFSSGAKAFAEGVSARLVLIDGAELTRLMVRYNVGVSVRESFDLKQLDEELFDD